MLQEVNRIIETLEARPWSEHSEDMLLSAQGKLAVYLASLSGMVSVALHEYEIKEINSNNSEAEEYLKQKKKNITDGEAKVRAKLSIREKKEEVANAKKRYYEIRGIHEAVKMLITAIQVQLRTIDRERGTTQFQNK